MAIKHATIKVPGNTLAAVADWNADHTGTATPTNHGNEVHTSVFITGAEVPANETDPVYSAWILGPPNVSEFTNDAGYLAVEADPVFTAWDKDHADLSNVTSDQHHAKQHAVDSSADHTSTITENNLMDADANGLPDDSGLSVASVSGAVSASHAKQHSITATADHTSTATTGRILQADANGLPVNATNTDADVADAVTKKHSQNTDTALGSGCVADDHGAAATDQVINVCYGTGDPPAANTTTEGSLFVKYTA